MGCPEQWYGHVLLDASILREHSQFRPNPSATNTALTLLALWHVCENYVAAMRLTRILKTSQRKIQAKPAFSLVGSWWITASSFDVSVRTAATCFGMSLRTSSRLHRKLIAPALRKQKLRLRQRRCMREGPPFHFYPASDQVRQTTCPDNPPSSASCH